MAKTLQELTQNKNILLVGNSVEILQHNLKDKIESYDTIVRFGQGIPNKDNEDNEENKDDENLNNLIILDDSIKQIKNRPEVHKLVLNRRHLTQNPNEEGQAGLSVMITSQKYNAVDLILRTNMSDIFIFKTENQKELNAIKEELMADLSPEQQNELLKEAFKDKYSFLYIKGYEGTKDRYYIRFNKVVFDEADKEDNDDILIKAHMQEEKNDDLKNKK